MQRLVEGDDSLSINESSISANGFASICRDIVSVKKDMNERIDSEVSSLIE